MKVKSIKKNSINIKFLLLLLLVVTLLVVTISAYAQVDYSEYQAVTIVRGALFRRGPSGFDPAPYVKVTFYSPSIGRSSPTYTGTNGMYYFYNVPLGNYTLEIWGYGDNPITYSIQVYNQPYTDIQSIVIP